MRSMLVGAGQGLIMLSFLTARGHPRPRAQIQQKDHRIEDLLTLVGRLREDLDVESADRAELIAKLDEARQAEIVVDNYVHDDAPPAHHEGTVQVQVQENAGPSRIVAQELADVLKQVNELQDEVIGMKTQQRVTAEALEVDRLCNFVDGSVRAAWDVERNELKRKIERCTRERDDDGDIDGGQLKPVTLKAIWELLRRYDTSVHSLFVICTSSHLLVTKKYQNRRYDPVQLEGRISALSMFFFQRFVGDQAILSRMGTIEGGARGYCWSIRDICISDLPGTSFWARSLSMELPLVPAVLIGIISRYILSISHFFGDSPRSIGSGRGQRETSPITALVAWRHGQPSQALRRAIDHPPPPAPVVLLDDDEDDQDPE
ncbi:hypothetical protein R1sor_010854 [Riccia sorocarpa]|uniref:Uncharacterized protein n=1 Tax=Riccia sorocarpa TaxID=122646 RepID=A0ABD3HZ85_9MARC